MTSAPLPAALHPPLKLIAHRGGSLLFPENTLTAFEGAASAFAPDMIECDIHLSKDGEIVVLHDKRLDRTTDQTGFVAERTAAELAQVDAGFRFTTDGGATFPFRGQQIGVPTLAEAIEKLPGMRWNVEVKPLSPALVDRLASLIREHGLEERIVVGSANPVTHEIIARKLPDVPRFFSKADIKAFTYRFWTGRLRGYTPPDPIQRAMQVPEAYHGIPLVTRRFIDAAHRFGFQVHLWTVNTEADMNRLLDLGADGLMSDRPDLLQRVLVARGLRP